MKAARRSDWKTEDLPSQHRSLALNRSFNRVEMAIIRQGVVPRQMEDKWFVFWEDGRLYFHRSWTGHCIFVARFKEDGDSGRLTGALANQDPEQYGPMDDTALGSMLDYLIDLLLLHRQVEYPENEPDEQKKTMMAWQAVGRAMLGEFPNADESDVEY